MSDARVDRQVSAGWFWKALAEELPPRSMTEVELGLLIDRTRKSGHWNDADLLSDIYRERFESSTT